MNDVNFRIRAGEGEEMELHIPVGYTLDEMMGVFELIVTFLGYSPVELEWEYREKRLE